MRRHLSGLEPERVSNTVLRLHPGSCSDASGNKDYESNAAIDIDLTHVGAGGLDTGAPQSNQDYFVYLVANGNGKLGAVCSAALAYGGVVVPAGHTLVRKLPFGFVYRLSGTWQGIPAFHLCYWPKPYVHYSFASMAPAFCVLASGSRPAWTAVKTNSFVPDNARLIRVLTKVQQAGGISGIAFVRTAAPAEGINLGGTGLLTLDLRTTSNYEIEYKVTNGARLSIWALGYSMTEPS